MKEIKADTRFFIIGNADEAQKHEAGNTWTSHIRHNDIVIRFNNPNPSCSVSADWLFIANGCEQLRRLSIQSTFIKPDAQIFFRYHLTDILLAKYQYIPLHKRIKYLWRFPLWVKRFQLNSYNTQTIPAATYQYCMNSLHLDSLPSTGLLAIVYVLRIYPGRKVFIHNFSHQGWAGHNWSSEEKIIQQWQNQNLIEKI